MNTEKTKEEEPKVKLYRLTITESIEAADIDEARRIARAKFAGVAKDLIEQGVARVTKAKYSSRADRLSEAESMVSDAQGVVEELKDELQEWYDNLPDNFKDGDKGSQLQEAIDALESLHSNLEEAIGNFGVDFPGMY